MCFHCCDLMTIVANVSHCCWNRLDFDYATKNYVIQLKYLRDFALHCCRSLLGIFDCKFGLPSPDIVKSNAYFKNNRQFLFITSFALCRSSVRRCEHVSMNLADKLVGIAKLRNQPNDRHQVNAAYEQAITTNILMYIDEDELRFYYRYCKPSGLIM